MLLLALPLVFCPEPCLATIDTFVPKETSRYRVLVLHSYYQGYKWTDDQHAGIESILRPIVGTSRLYIEYMDSKKIYGDAFTRRLYEIYKLKYSKVKFDVIIVTDENAFEFTQKYRDALFPGTPVVFCGVNYLSPEDLKKHSGFTGVNEENDFKGCVELILKLHPKTRQILFIHDWSETGQKLRNAFTKVIPHFKKPVKFLLPGDEKIEDILEQLRNLPPDSVVLYSDFSRDRLGRTFEYTESIAAVALNCKVPIYTTHEFNPGLGVMGGLVLTGSDQGELAAKMALRILLGEKPEKIPVETVSPKRYVFDYQQMRAFNVSQADLPKGSIIANLPQTFYFKHKKLLDALVVILFTLVSIISVLLVALHKQKAIGGELKESREQLRTLSWRLANAVEKERKVLSRELHDQVGQNLTILGVNMNVLKSRICGEVADMSHSLIVDSLAIVEQTTELIRNLMNNLRSPVLDDYGLVAAIDLYGRQLMARTGIEIEMRGPKTDPRVPVHIETTLFRIVQESLTNVVKHARAKKVIISVVVTDARIILSIEDNGIGYNRGSAANTDEEHGWGLITMTERTLALGGECRIQSSPGLGTHIIVEVPI